MNSKKNSVPAAQTGCWSTLSLPVNFGLQLNGIGVGQTELSLKTDARCKIFFEAILTQVGVR